MFFPIWLTLQNFYHAPLSASLVPSLLLQIILFSILYKWLFVNDYDIEHKANSIEYWTNLIYEAKTSDAAARMAVWIEDEGEAWIPIDRRRKGEGW